MTKLGLLDDITKEIEQVEIYDDIELCLPDASVQCPKVRKSRNPYSLLPRIYEDEVPRPDSKFCIERALKFCDKHLPVACAWTRLRWKI